MAKKKKRYKSIFSAIVCNDIETVKTFLPEQLETRDDCGRTLLHWACQYGHTEIARLLLDSGADIEAKDDEKKTLLHYACYFGHTEIVRLLLDRGANIEARDNYDYSPINYACLYKYTEIVSMLLDNGIDIEARDNDDRTLLHLVCIWGEGHHSVSEFLVSRGADPFVKNRYEKSPLDCDTAMVKDKDGNEVPHSQILIHLRNKYLMNQHALKESERTAALLSGWEMEM